MTRRCRGAAAAGGGGGGAARAGAGGARGGGRAGAGAGGRGGAVGGRPSVADGSGPTLSSAPRAQPEVFGNIFIGIAGMIGAGKSTLAAARGRPLGIRTHSAPVA